MDCLKLFALLVAVASVQITAETPKKKIRIHIPQKVKHIHHHKKIYITNHPASSQYAPAFMPSAEGTVAVPTNVAMANVLPLHSLELYDESPTRKPEISAASSKLLSLYRARGYYGPTPTEWDDHDYDLEPPESADDSYIPPAYEAPSATPTVSSSYQPKRVKILKLNESARKKVPRKNKPKKVAVRNKKPQIEDEHPVTTFHEHFYSDIDGSGTIRKIKKPQRVEKIIDGDTEHIHTYSEEHIHKLVFNDGSKHPGVVGIGSMSAVAASRPVINLKNPPALIAIAPDATGFAAVGPISTSPHLNYAAYNPLEVTHDHIFHDHGEISTSRDLAKGHLPLPLRTTHTRQGIRIGNIKGHKSRYPVKYVNPQLKPSHVTDFSYKHAAPTAFESVDDDSLEDYKPVVPSFNFKNNGNIKTSNVVPAIYFDQGKEDNDYRLKQTNIPGPYMVSNAVVHEYKPKQYSEYSSGKVRLSKFNADIYNYPNNNDDLQLRASSSNSYTADNYPRNFPVKKGQKKSISTQNISFGGLDHQTTVNHLKDTGSSATFHNSLPSAFDNSFIESQPQDSAPSTAFTIRQSSPVHPYYSAMALKALHNGDQLSLAEASNDNYQYAKAPSSSTTSEKPSLDITTVPSVEYYEIQNSETTESTNFEMRPDQDSHSLSEQKVHRPKYKIIGLQSPTHTSKISGQNYHNADSESTLTETRKYGDKI